MINYHPGDDLGIQLTSSSDDVVDVDEMIDDINRIAQTYGFKVRQWGEWLAFRRSAIAEEKYIEEAIKAVKDYGEGSE